MEQNKKICEMCGKKEDLKKTIIEGSTLTVCDDCAKYGSIIEVAQEKTTQRLNKKIKIEDILEVITSDYPEKIKAAREKLNLKQEQLAKKISTKASVIHKLESRHLEPSIDLAKKLEHFLNIKLIEEYEEEERNINTKDETLTLGDLITIKDKRKK